MKRDAAEIPKEALALPTEARAALAGSLLDSVDSSYSLGSTGSLSRARTPKTHS
jgi:hypothetical protein